MAAQGDKPSTFVFFARVKLMDVRLLDVKRRSPLHWAIVNSSRLTLEYILAHDQDLEVRDFDGMTPLHLAILTLPKEQSPIFVKTLIVRGSKIDALTERGQTCISLIPEEISDELQGKVKLLLRKHRCRCQFMITFRFLPIKYERGRCTQIFFCLLIFFLVFTHLTVVVPQSPPNAVDYTISVIHMLLLVIVTISYFWTGCKDPGYLKKQY